MSEEMTNEEKRPQLAHAQIAACAPSVSLRPPEPPYPGYKPPEPRYGRFSGQCDSGDIYLYLQQRQAQRTRMERER